MARLQCFECGSSNSNLQGHHVVPEILGGTRTIPLCEKCHSKVHGKNMSISTLTKKALAERKAKGLRLGRPFGEGKSKLDVHTEEIKYYLANGATSRFILSVLKEKYNLTITESNFGNYIKKKGLSKVKKSK